MILHAVELYPCAARAHLAGHAVHPAVSRAGPALLQLPPRLIAGGWKELSYIQGVQTARGPVLGQLCT